jgi:uncharacterized protein with beta-barrel porin domain
MTAGRTALTGVLLLLGCAQAVRAETPGGLSNLSWRGWSSLFAGRSLIGADAATGTPAVTASVTGLTLGSDTLLDDDTLVGASLSASRQTFSSGTGLGVSDDRAIALYGRHRLFGQAYLSEALGYGWHNIDTSRSVRLGGLTVLQASLQAEDAGGRVEAGYAFGLDGARTLSPYVALVGDAYSPPAYREKVAQGSPRFAAAFAAATIGIVHGELGVHYEDGWRLAEGGLSLEALGAWEQELTDNPFVLTAFLADPAVRFQARGARPAVSTALAGLGLRYTTDSKVSFGLRGDTRLGSRTTIFSGTLDITFNW